VISPTLSQPRNFLTPVPSILSTILLWMGASEQLGESLTARANPRQLLSHENGQPVACVQTFLPTFLREYLLLQIFVATYQPEGYKGQPTEGVVYSFATPRLCSRPTLELAAAFAGLLVSQLNSWICQNISLGGWE